MKFMTSHDLESPTRYLTNTWDSAPPTQTVCDRYELATTTVYKEQATQTAYDVDYVTYNTWVTVWVG